MTGDMKFVKETYDHINSVPCQENNAKELMFRALRVGRVEKIIGVSFKGTTDWHNKVGQYLRGELFTGETLKSMRMRKGWTQDTLSCALNTKKGNVSNMEKGVRPLTEKAVEFIIKTRGS